MTLSPGQSLGKFQILGQLGSGGMASVYKAYQPSLEREVALKVLRGGYAEDKEFVARFEREARAIARLRHPNIVQVFDFEQLDGRYVLAMEYLEGGTLKDRLVALAQEGRGLEPAESVRIISEVASALSFAHDRQIVHRDVKPSNVMLAEGDRAVVTDFGIAKMLEGATSHTQTGVGIGTPEYMSPEQGQASKAVDARADIYSLGVMAYELLTGRLPFTADTPLAVVLAHIRDPLPLPSAVNPTIGRQTERALLKALAKDPAQRFSSAREFATALADGLAADGKGGALPTVIYGAGAVASRISRARSSRSLSIPLLAIAGRPPLLAAAVVAGLVLVSGIGFAVTRSSAGPAGSTAPPEPTPIDPIPKGALYWEAKLDGTQSFIRPGTLGLNRSGPLAGTSPEPGAVELRTPTGAIEIANRKGLTSLEFAFDAPTRQNYVAELDVEFPAGSKQLAQFPFRRVSGGASYWFQLEPADGWGLIQHNPGTGGSAATQRLSSVATVPGIKEGRKVTVAFVVEDSRFTLFADGRQQTQATDTRLTPSAQPLFVSNYAIRADATGTIRISRVRFFELDRTKVAPLPSAAVTAVPTPSRTPSPTPKFAIPAKGGLVREAKLDGSAAFTPRTDIRGATSDSDVRYGPGFAELSVSAPSAGSTVGVPISPLRTFVGELEVMGQPEPRTQLRWYLRQTSGGGGSIMLDIYPGDRYAQLVILLGAGRNKP